MCLRDRTHVSSSKGKKCESQKSWPKMVCTTFTLLPKVVESWKSKLRGSFFKALLPITSIHTSSKTGSLSTFCQFFLTKISLNFSAKFSVDKWNVGDHLKHVFPKFEAKRSHPQGVNGRSKFEKYKNHLSHNVFLFKMRFFFSKNAPFQREAYTKKESKVFVKTPWKWWI